MFAVFVYFDHCLVLSRTEDNIESTSLMISASACPFAHCPHITQWPSERQKRIPPAEIIRIMGTQCIYDAISVPQSMTRLPTAARRREQGEGLKLLNQMLLERYIKSEIARVQCLRDPKNRKLQRLNGGEDRRVLGAPLILKPRW